MRLDVNAPERVVPALDESSLCFVENWAGAVSSSYPETRGFTNDQAMDFRESDEYSTYRKFHISRFTINRVLMAQIHILEGDIVDCTRIYTFIVLIPSGFVTYKPYSYPETVVPNLDESIQR